MAELNEEKFLMDDAPISFDVQRTLKLIPCDNPTKSFDVNVQHAQISNLIKTSFSSDPSMQEMQFKFEYMTERVLNRIVEYMNHHKNNEPAIIESPLQGDTMAANCKDAWDATFIDQIGENKDLLHDLAEAANYMGMNVLLHLAAAKIALTIKDLPDDVILDMLTEGHKLEEDDDEDYKEDCDDIEMLEKEKKLITEENESCETKMPSEGQDAPEQSENKQENAEEKSVEEGDEANESENDKNEAEGDEEENDNEQNTMDTQDSETVHIKI